MATQTVTAPILLDSTGQQIKTILEQVSIMPQIVDNLTTSDNTKALSAKQGKVLNDTVTDLASRLVIIEKDVLYSSYNGWKYTGASVTIPANCVFTFSARGGWNMSLSRQVAIMQSSTTLSNEDGAFSIDGQTYVSGMRVRPWVTRSGVTYSSPITYYLWVRHDETYASANERAFINGFYIKL